MLVVVMVVGGTSVGRARLLDHCRELLLVLSQFETVGACLAEQMLVTLLLFLSCLIVACVWIQILRQMYRVMT